MNREWPCYIGDDPSVGFTMFNSAGTGALKALTGDIMFVGWKPGTLGPPQWQALASWAARYTAGI